MRTLLTVFALFAPALTAMAESAAVESVGAPTPDIRAIGLACTAALAFGIGVACSAHAIARIGTAAMGAAAEKPELLTRALLFVALAEGLAVLGFVIAIMLLQRM